MRSHVGGNTHHEHARCAPSITHMASSHLTFLNRTMAKFRAESDGEPAYSDDESDDEHDDPATWPTAADTAADTAAVRRLLSAFVPLEIAIVILDYAGFWVCATTSRHEPVVYDAPAAPYVSVTIASAAKLRAIVFRSVMHRASARRPAWLDVRVSRHNARRGAFLINW